MTRHEIESAYKVERGIIRSPGQFEGEAVYLPHYWDIAKEGFADDDDGRTFSVKVTPEDRAEFPGLKRRRVIKFYQRDDGCICELALWRL